MGAGAELEPLGDWGAPGAAAAPEDQQQQLAPSPRPQLAMADTGGDGDGGSDEEEDDSLRALLLPPADPSFLFGKGEPMCGAIQSCGCYT